MEDIGIKRLSPAKIWGFSIGTVGEYFVYFLFFNYFLYYLTDIVGIGPGIAGTILMIAMIWDAITDPIIGYVNDISTNPKGRRRPMMAKTFIPFIITFGLCFFRPNIEPGMGLYVYYTLVALAFWLCFTMEQVPFYGLLPEIAPHEEDRLKIRAAMAFVGNAGNLAIGIVPIALEFVIGLGVDETFAWTVTMFVLGAIGGASFLVTWAVTKGMETPPEKVVRPKDNIFVTYKKILQLKGYIPTVLIYFFSTVFINLVFASIMYVGGEKLSLPASQLSIVMSTYTFSGVIFVPLITIFNRKLGAIKAFKLFIVITFIGYILVGLVGVNSFGIMLAHGLLTAGSFVLFTAYNYALFYEVCDLGFIKTGDQLEGSIISFATFGYKMGAAVSGFSMGIALEIIGYDGTVETKSVEMLSKLDALITYIPAILIVVIFLLLISYPIKRDEYKAIAEAKHLKEEGKEYDTAAFDRLLK